MTSPRPDIKTTSLHDISTIIKEIVFLGISDLDDTECRIYAFFQNKRVIIIIFVNGIV